MDLFDEWTSGDFAFKKEVNQEDLLIEVASCIHAEMDSLNMSKKELSKHLGVSQARITQMLNGETNFTLRSLADIFTAFDKTLKLTARTQEEIALSSRKATWCYPLKASVNIAKPEVFDTQNVLIGDKNETFDFAA